MLEQFVVSDTVGTQGVSTYSTQESLGSAYEFEEVTDERLAGLIEYRDLLFANYWNRVRQRRVLPENKDIEVSVLGSNERKWPQPSANVSFLSNWYALAHSDLSARTFGRLQITASRLAEGADSEAAQTLNAALQLFLQFWKEAKDEGAEPDLFVLPNGRLQALWSHANGSFLVIEFVGNEKVFWAVNEVDSLTEGEQAGKRIGFLAKNLKSLVSSPLKWRC